MYNKGQRPTQQFKSMAYRTLIAEKPLWQRPPTSSHRLFEQYLLEFVQPARFESILISDVL